MNNLSEEEKKAIELTKTIIEFAGDSYIPKENRKALQVLLNLIDNQQKEIVKLKKDYSDMLLEENVISKDKIREKIKEINVKSFENKCNYSEYYYKKEVLQELLEE